MEENFQGATILGDCHYAAGKELANLKFLVQFEKDPKFSLTKEQERWNSSLRAIRSRLESPFSQMKTKFAALGRPFSEGDDQHIKLLTIAAGVHNDSLAHQ